VLLIAYKYPPYAGVGGYRWAKLSKYLARLGHDVHVVTVPWRAGGPNTLTADVQDERITIHTVRSGGPHKLRHRPIGNRYLSFARELGLRALDRTLYFDDEAQHWGRHLLPACERLVAEHGIEVAVATGHPFQANRWALELKRRLPELKLVQDLRDPWADNPFRRLTPKQEGRVRAWQREAVEGADAIVTVTEGLRELYLRDARQERAFVIRNGFDPESAPARVARENGPLRMVHAGNVSNARDEPLRRLLDATRRRGEAADWRIVLAGRVGGDIADDYRDLLDSGRLELRPPLRHEDALGLIADSDVALHLGAAAVPYALSTKIYEHAMLRVPTLSLNYGGEVAELVAAHGLGRSVNLRADDLEAALDDLDRLGSGLAFDADEFAYPALARRYSELLESLRAG
jgi:glycosyltransferase involved in cell wall biosynthesis